MDLTRRLRQRQTLVDRALATTLKPLSGSPKVLSQAIRYCVFSGGKRFRPLLCLGGCEAVGGNVRQALPVACALELLHTYSLVHDDLPAMDNAHERRGQPSCHRQFGEATAILVGDALLTRAFEILSADRIPNTLAILRTIGGASGTGGLIGGQMLDLQHDGQHGKSTPARLLPLPERAGHPGPPLAPARAGRPPRPASCPRRGGQATVKQLEEIAKRKTAALITASVVAGGLAGHASFQDLGRLRQYGLQLGLAFQLIDDLHDQDGFVRAIGSQAVLERAQQLIGRAKQALSPFQTRAWALLELANWLARA